MTARDQVEEDYRARILDSRRKLMDLTNDNAPWYDPKTERMLKSVVRALGDRYNEHNNALKSGNAKLARVTGGRLRDWNNRAFTQMIIDLEDESRRLIGSRQRWSRTRWGRPLAFVTRHTRFFSIIRWLRHGLAWFLIVPGGLLVGALLAILTMRLITR